MPKKAAKKSVKKTPHKLPKKSVKAPVVKTQPVATQTTSGVLKRVPSAWRLTVISARLLWQHKRLFLTLTLIYGLLNLILVRGLASGTNVSELKSELSNVFTGNLGSLASSLSVFVVLVGGSGNDSSQTAGAYQLFLTLVVSLAVIWALRQVMAERIVRARDTFYQGMYPLIPFILTLIIVGLQLIPLIIGATIYATVIGNGIAVGAVEQALWAVLFLGLAALTLYLLCASLFGLYIVTLPDMTPRRALRSAQDLVKGRRLLVLRKVLFLPLVLLVISAAIMVPIIIVITPVAQWIFFVLSMFSLVAIHTYMYVLYRELLNE